MPPVHNHCAKLMSPIRDILSRPSGTENCLWFRLPGTEVPGYSNSVPPGRRLIYPDFNHAKPRDKVGSAAKYIFAISNLETL